MKNKLIGNKIQHTTISSDKFSREHMSYQGNKKEHRIQLPEGYLERLDQKRYSKNTVKTNVNYFKDFMKYFKGYEIHEITPDQINCYILDLIRNKNISHSQQNQRINSINFYYEKVLQQEKQKYDIDRPRRAHTLPEVLSKEEIKAIIDSCSNLKHKAMLGLLYSSGLRHSELLNLKISDVDSKRMLLRIVGSKGKKDRYSLLSNYSLNLLRKYYLQYKPKKWLFEGINGNQYSPTSLQNILKHAARKANIQKRVHLHMLRHSFATHLLEQGTNIRLIQEILGHESIKTTEIYIHISNHELKNIKNPADKLFT